MTDTSYAYITADLAKAVTIIARRIHLKPEFDEEYSVLCSVASVVTERVERMATRIDELETVTPLRKGRISGAHNE